MSNSTDKCKWSSDELGNGSLNNKEMIVLKIKWSGCFVFWSDEKLSTGIDVKTMPANKNRLV